MPDTLTFASRRPASLVRSAGGAIELVGRSSAILRVHELIRRASASDSSVLLVAEHGIDVESVARELHQRGKNAGGPFIGVDVATENGRLESELFGGGSSDRHDL